MHISNRVLLHNFNFWIMEQTHEFLNKLSQLEQASFISCLVSYITHCPSEEIVECGYNNRTGYVYIALLNGIAISSAFNEPVEYIVFDDDENLTPHFFDSYQDALIHEYAK